MSRVLGRVLGIDLGTIHCRVAVIDGDAPIVIPNAMTAAPFTPAVVAFRGQSADEIVVGAAAEQQVRANPRSTIRTVKRLMGHKIDDPEVRRHRLDVGYEVIAAKNGDACVRVRGRRYAPAEIVAMILRDLTASAEKALGEPATHAVISVPSFFNEVQRQATRQAAALAGLDLLRLVNDPTAAALSYARGERRNPRQEDKLVVYDLGGGFFDVSLLELRGDEVEVKATWGDGFLGGEDFDQRIAVHLANAFHATHGLDLRNDEAGMQQLRRLAVGAKHALSQASSTDVSWPMTGPRAATASVPAETGGGPPPLPGTIARRPPRRRQGTPLALTVTLTRAELESLTKDMVDRTLFPCEAALQDAGWEASEVDAVITSGALGRMPRARELLAEVFGKRPLEPADGEAANAIGAAILGERLRRPGAASGVTERVAVSLGVETAGGVFTRLIPKNTPLPASRAQVFSTVADDQAQIVIQVLQGEREMAADNKSLGRYKIAPIAPGPRGTPQIEVQVSIDESGLVQVAASNLQTGQRQNVAVTETTHVGG